MRSSIFADAFLKYEGLKAWLNCTTISGKGKVSADRVSDHSQVDAVNNKWFHHFLLTA
jgi:hypothetical protein